MRIESWRDQEPGFATAIAQARCLLALGFRSPVRTLIGSFIVAVGCVALAAWQRPTHTPRVVIRVTEMDRDPSTLPKMKRQLVDYVREAVFTTDSLLDIIRRHGLYGSLARRNPQAAIEGFREDIEVEVFQNYFVEDRNAGKPRTARIAVSYGSREREVALAVTRDLGRLVIERERRSRSEQTSLALSTATLTLDGAARALSARRGEILSKRLEIAASARADPIREVELVSLLGSLEQKQRAVDEARARKTALEVSVAVEREGVGTSFEVADEGSVPKSAERGTKKLAALGVAAFFLLLPFVALLNGAFDSKRGPT